MNPRCPRCGLAPLVRNEDGDPACWLCGHVVLMVPAWVAETNPGLDQTGRRRRQPSTNGRSL